MGASPSAVDGEAVVDGGGYVGRIEHDHPAVRPGRRRLENSIGADKEEEREDKVISDSPKG